MTANAIDLNSTTPAAPAGRQNVIIQYGTGSPVPISAYVPAPFSYDSAAGQTASMGPITIFTPAADGAYRIFVYVAIASSTSTSVTCRFDFTDEYGNAQFDTFNFGPLSGVHWDYLSDFFFAKGGTNITFTITVTGTISYTAHVRVQPL